MERMQAQSSQLLENVPQETNIKSMLRRDTVSTASPSDLELSDLESSDEDENHVEVVIDHLSQEVATTMATSENEENSSPPVPSASPCPPIGKLDAETVAGIILESLDKAKKAGSTPSTPKSQKTMVTTRSPSSKLYSISPKSPGTPRTLRVPNTLTKYTVPRVPRTPKTPRICPRTPSLADSPRSPVAPLLGTSVGSPSTPVTPSTPGSVSSSISITMGGGLASKICESQSEDPVWHPDFWCADLLDFENDGPRSSEFSSDDEFEFEDESSVITDISELSDHIAEFLDAKEALPGSVVRFKEIIVRDYEQILGDHPACSNGPSVSIGWKYEEHKPLRIKHYESMRMRVHRKKQMVLSRRKREQMLSRLGYSRNEMAEATRESNKIRTQRRQTANNMGSESLGAALQSATRKMKSLFSMSKRRR